MSVTRNMYVESISRELHYMYSRRRVNREVQTVNWETGQDQKAADVWKKDVWHFQVFSQTFFELRFSLGNKGKDGKNLNSQTWPGTPNVLLPDIRDLPTRGGCRNVMILKRIKGAQTMKCKLWIETLDFSRLKVPNSRFPLHGLAPPNITVCAPLLPLIHGLCAFFRLLLTPLLTAPSAPPSQFTVCTSRLVRLRNTLWHKTITYEKIFWNNYFWKITNFTRNFWEKSVFPGDSEGANSLKNYEK